MPLSSVVSRKERDRSLKKKEAFILLPDEAEILYIAI